MSLPRADDLDQRPINSLLQGVGLLGILFPQCADSYTLYSFVLTPSLCSNCWSAMIIFFGVPGLIRVSTEACFSFPLAINYCRTWHQTLSCSARRTFQWRRIDNGSSVLMCFTIYMIFVWQRLWFSIEVRWLFYYDNNNSIFPYAHRHHFFLF